MRELTIPESGPKRKLLDAAEQLFAEKGFEAVSVRDVTQFVKMNVAAVNYHFGSREGMLTLVILRYAGPVNEERLARLESAERKWAGKGLPLEEIIDAFVRPLLGQVRKTALSEGLFYKLLGRIFAENGDGLSPIIEERLRQTSDRFARAFGKALPTIGAEELVARIHFMTGGLVHLLTHQDMLANGASGLPSMEVTLTRFIRFAVAGLREGTDTEVVVKKGPQAMFDF
ncbi:MAG: TetR family transcriptional regulator [Luteolibacter sp.]